MPKSKRKVDAESAVADALVNELVRTINRGPSPPSRKQMVDAAWAGLTAMKARAPGSAFVGLLWDPSGGSLRLLPAGFKILPDAGAGIVQATAEELLFLAEGLRASARRRHRANPPLWLESDKNDVRLVRVTVPKTARRKAPRPVNNLKRPWAPWKSRPAKHPLGPVKNPEAHRRGRKLGREKG